MVEGKRIRQGHADILTHGIKVPTKCRRQSCAKGWIPRHEWVQLLGLLYIQECKERCISTLLTCPICEWVN
eukprot:2878073-Amphidinium_carterae.1